MTKSPPFTSSLPRLRSLHRLPIKFSSLFEISLLTYTMLPEKQPVYLHSMLAPSLPSPSPKSNKGISLSVPTVKINSCARALHSCAPSLWYDLPLSVCSAIFSCYLQEISADTSLWLGHSRIDTDTPDGLVILRNRFVNFAFECWFSCCTTELYWHSRNFVDWLIAEYHWPHRIPDE